VDGTTVLRDIFVRHHELLERRLDLVEVDIGDEAINAGNGAEIVARVGRPKARSRAS
jgi:hypothetical protein